MKIQNYINGTFVDPISNEWIANIEPAFGGQKASGIVREGGFEALGFFTEPKNICIKY